MRYETEKEVDDRDDALNTATPTPEGTSPETAPDPTTTTATPTPVPAPWKRRAFLRAAALGAAVAGALLVDDDERGRLRLGGARALADDLSSFQCTANDVRILGPGRVLNEPCDCPTGTTFTAEVAFEVENNAASARGCIMLHLAGGPFAVGDIILNGGEPIDGKTKKTMIGLIENWPCGAGLVCFGSVADDGRSRCTAPCSTVSWTVPGQDNCPPDRQISSKCRHQQICIRGRGISLACVANPAHPEDTCEPLCGGTATLMLCGSGELPATFALSPSDPTTGEVLSGPVVDADGDCATFRVRVMGDCTFTGTMTFADDCAKTATHPMEANPIALTSHSATAPDCAGGDTTLAACASGATSFEFFQGAASLGTVAADAQGCASHSVELDPGTHTNLSVTAHGAPGCSASANYGAVIVPEELTVELALTGHDNCDGELTFTATASGGTAPYKYDFKVDGSGGMSGTSNAFDYGPKLDGSCHEISCLVTDDHDCTATAKLSVKQCVTTSTDDCAADDEP